MIADAAIDRDAAPIVWIAGVGWDETIGTDRRIVTEIARARPVIWLDPPNRSAWRGCWRSADTGIEELGGITRIRVPATVGVTRWPLRALSRLLQRQAIGRARRQGASTVVLANPLARFPRDPRVHKILYVTDDWIAGAPLMGYSPRLVARILAANARQAEGMAAVTEPLLQLVRGLRGRARTGQDAVIPNGAPALTALSVPRVTPPVAGIVGQLNERLDVGLLSKVAEAGIPLRIVGPRVGRGSDFDARLDALLSHPMVDWRGRVPADEVAEHLAEISVGLTPYVDSEFNRASSPLKTLEYLSAGVPVVSTDLPASRWLDTAHVVVADDHDAFVRAVDHALATGSPPSDAEDRRRFAAGHSWTRRAERFIGLIDEVERPRSMEARSLG